MRAVTARRFLVMYFVWMLVFNMPAIAGRAASIDEKLQIEVQPGDWGSSSLADIDALLNNVKCTILANFDDAPTGTIQVVRRNGGPMIAYRKSSSDPYRIMLNADNRLWARMSYQFSHDFLHLLMGYEDLRGEEDAPHPYGWFFESLCELSSIATLRQMARNWKTDPPYPNWRDYSKSLGDYAQGLLDTPARALPAGVSLADWYAANRNVLRANHSIRPLNGVVANALLPLFEKHPAGWDAVRFMPDETGPIDRFFRSWRRKAPERHWEFIGRIAARFGVEIAEK